MVKVNVGVCCTINMQKMAKPITKSMQKVANASAKSMQKVANLVDKQVLIWYINYVGGINDKIIWKKID